MDAGGSEGDRSSRTVRVSGCIAFDCALQAALRSEGCRRNRLLIEGPWRWLLERFATGYGVRSFYVLLAHLRCGGLGGLLYAQVVCAAG